MEWIINNKEWLFSGILIALPIAIIGWSISKKRKYNKKNNQRGSGNINIGDNNNINNSFNEQKN